MNSTIIKQMEQARKIIKVITGNNYRVQKLEKDTRKVVRSINPEIEEKFDKLNVLPYGYTLTFPFLNIFVITNNEEEYQMDMSDAENVLNDKELEELKQKLKIELDEIDL